MILFNKARSGASGKAATNMVVNPNWRTEKENERRNIIFSHVYFMHIVYDQRPVKVYTKN